MMYKECVYLWHDFYQTRRQASLNEGSERSHTSEGFSLAAAVREWGHRGRASPSSASGHVSASCPVNRSHRKFSMTNTTAFVYLPVKHKKKISHTQIFSWGCLTFFLFFNFIFVSIFFFFCSSFMIFFSFYFNIYFIKSDRHFNWVVGSICFNIFERAISSTSRGNIVFLFTFYCWLGKGNFALISPVK